MSSRVVTSQQETPSIEDLALELSSVKQKSLSTISKEEQKFDNI